MHGTVYEESAQAHDNVVELTEWLVARVHEMIEKEKEKKKKINHFCTS